VHTLSSDFALGIQGGTRIAEPTGAGNGPVGSWARGVPGRCRNLQTALPYSAYASVPVIVRLRRWSGTSRHRGIGTSSSDKSFEPSVGDFGDHSTPSLSSNCGGSGHQPDGSFEGCDTSKTTGPTPKSARIVGVTCHRKTWRRFPKHRCEATEVGFSWRGRRQKMPEIGDFGFSGVRQISRRQCVVELALRAGGS